MDQTFRVRKPTAPPVALVYDTPHSGRSYPSDWITKASSEDLRRGEDAYVDELLVGGPAHGATVLEALRPRCYIDLNRGETDIDAEMLAEPWPVPLEPTEKTKRGLGLIRKYVVPGVEINGERIAVADVQRRIETVYRPYHNALRSLLNDVAIAHDGVWHVNWHSMKSAGNAMTPDGPGATRADFVVSDRDGTSAEPQLTDLIVTTLRRLGYSVSVNDPYKGGTIIQHSGAPGRGFHSVQVEINRALYLDEVTVQRTRNFAAVALALETLSADLAAAAPVRA